MHALSCFINVKSKVYVATIEKQTMACVYISHRPFQYIVFCQVNNSEYDTAVYPRSGLQSGVFCGNAVAENFFSILKTECIYPNNPNTFQQAEKLIHDFMFFYNHQHIQLKTGMASLELRHHSC